VPPALVRWAKTGRFGLEFIRLSEEDRVLLQRLIRRHWPGIAVWEWDGGVEIVAASGD
jgi:hypothetical protein